ncbi:Uncharacterised protein [Myroides odoratimimus]|uniref:Uncharacterized protein n=1 Tax=Myroides odoratimimus CCUG 10230 TaxID=883150 RepID=A0ABP2NFY0_9FLAO|nr:hypothetical protein HMPREF9712_00009 [Myroides odoratimimus CCUG 10230]STZ47895.1 Uncharacterised protein [Myroides odoratimimus]
MQIYFLYKKQRNKVNINKNKIKNNSGKIYKHSTLKHIIKNSYTHIVYST